MTQHDKSHGAAYDRGGADYWYARPVDPHYYTNGTRTTDLTPKQRKAYIDGYEDGEADGGQKDWT